MFRVGNLEALGQGMELPGRMEPRKDQGTIWHEWFYARYQDDLRDVYMRFLRTIVRPLFGSHVIYQRVPTFRIHLPGNVAVGEYHTDGESGHQEGEINFWVPLTRTAGHSSVWIESRPGSRVYEALSAGPGDILVWDSVRLRHGNQVNTTDRTRVSFDFRCIHP